MPPNDLLHRALADARLTERDLATKIGANPKTVARWLAGERLPHQRTRWAVAEALGVDEVALWPAAAQAAFKRGPDKEIITVYPSHSAVPDTVWRSLVAEAEHDIVFCDTVSYWYWWSVPTLTNLLRDRAEAGVRIRVMIGDKDDPLIAEDEEATGSALTLSARIDQTLQLLEPLRDVVQVRRTMGGWGRSVYRGDDQACLHWWVAGQMGIEFPVQHIRKRMNSGLFDSMAVKHVEALWESATAVW